MTARAEILKAIDEFMRQTGQSEFSPQDIVDLMQRKGTQYAESTIRTHITSRLCANAPDNHGVVYDDLERTNRGKYRLKSTVS